MTKKELIIFGTEKMADLAYFYFSNDSKYNVVAFTVESKYLNKKNFLGLPVISFEEVEKIYPPDKFNMFIAIGYKKLNTLRTKKYLEAKSKGYKLVSYICSKSILWYNLEIGDNCFILENQVFQPYVKIGNNVFIWSGNHFGHDVVIEDNCYLASHIVLSGGVKIGANSFIGVNSTFRDNVIIGNNCLIGAGSLITNNVEDNSVYIAKPTEKYLLNSEQFEKMMDISK